MPYQFDPPNRNKFGFKDTLPADHPEKIIKGREFDDEFKKIEDYTTQLEQDLQQNINEAVGIEEAPFDQIAYARQQGEWTPVDVALEDPNYAGAYVRKDTTEDQQIVSKFTFSSTPESNEILGEDIPNKFVVDSSVKEARFIAGSEAGVGDGYYPWDVELQGSLQLTNQAFPPSYMTYSAFGITKGTSENASASEVYIRFRGADDPDNPVIEDPQPAKWIVKPNLDVEGDLSVGGSTEITGDITLNGGNIIIDGGQIVDPDGNPQTGGDYVESGTLKEDSSVAAHSTAYADNTGVAIGYNAIAGERDEYCVAIGVDSKAGVLVSPDASKYATAIGYKAKAEHSYSIALGSYAQTTDPNQFMIGSPLQRLNVKIYGTGTMQAADFLDADGNSIIGGGDSFWVEEDNGSISRDSEVYVTSSLNFKADISAGASNPNADIGLDNGKLYLRSGFANGAQVTLDPADGGSTKFKGNIRAERASEEYIEINTTDPMGMNFAIMADGESKAYINSVGNAKFNATLTAGYIVKSGGTASQLLCADGSVVDKSSVGGSNYDGADAVKLTGDQHIAGKKEFDTTSGNGINFRAGSSGNRAGYFSMFCGYGGEADSFAIFKDINGNPSSIGQSYNHGLKDIHMTGWVNARETGGFNACIGSGMVGKYLFQDRKHGLYFEAKGGIQQTFIHPCRMGNKDTNKLVWLGDSGTRYGAVYGNSTNMFTVETESLKLRDSFVLTIDDVMDAFSTLRDATKDEDSVEGLRTAISDSIGGLLQKLQSMKADLAAEFEEKVEREVPEETVEEPEFIEDSETIQ